MMYELMNIKWSQARHPIYVSGPLRTVGIDLGVVVEDLSYAKEGNEVQNALRGVQQLATFTARFQDPNTGFKDAWEPTRNALAVAKSIPEPITKAVAISADFLVQIAYELFGDKPCKFPERGPCDKSYYPDGAVYNGGKCCDPFKNLTGKGIMAVQHSAGYKKYPGVYGEIPAGDYYRLDGQGVPRNMMLPIPASANMLRKNTRLFSPAVFAINDISSVFIPDGWWVEFYSQPGFQGEKIALGHGFHNIHEQGWGDKAVSAKVRGPWSIVDRTNADALKKKISGWVTERVTKSVTNEDVIMLLGLDPLRPKQPGYKYYESVWRPGWYMRLSEARVLGNPIFQMVWDKLGITQTDLQQERIISLEKTLNVLELLGGAARLENPQLAKQLLANSMTVEQLEIAGLLSRYSLDPQGIYRLYKYVSEQLKIAKQQAGISQPLWRKPRFELKDVPLETVFGSHFLA